MAGATEGLFGGLEWSGRWRIAVEVDDAAQLRAGMTDVVHAMAPGERFEGPRAFLGTCVGDLDQAGRELHRWALTYLCPPAPEGFPWIQYNQWYAHKYRFREEDLRIEAACAAELGCEIFIVDAGWWRGCEGRSFVAGLGNWVEDPEKFPGGFRAFRDYIKNTGMRFGLWVEPERVHLDTDIAREHTRDG